MLEEKIYHCIANKETFLIKSWGYAEAKEKAFHHLQSCYGNEYNILSFKDVTEELNNNPNKDEHLKLAI